MVFSGMSMVLAGGQYQALKGGIAEGGTGQITSSFVWSIFLTRFALKS